MTKARAEAIRQLHDKAGLTFDAIGTLLGISKQRTAIIYRTGVPKKPGRPKTEPKIKTIKKRGKPKLLSTEQYQENQRVSSRDVNRQLRLDAINKYGGKCVCCDETNIYFLSIDHSNKDGAQHRKEIRTNGGSSFYRWLRTNNYPNNIGLVILCWNCHLSKDFYGICPHKGDPDPNFIRTTKKRKYAKVPKLTL